LLLSLPTAAYVGQRGLTPAGLPHTTAQCHLTILGEAVLFCLIYPSFRTPGFGVIPFELMEKLYGS